jgi:hypothetical protein
MSAEAYITINGEPLHERQALVIRIAMMALADSVSNRERWKQKGVKVTNEYLLEIGAVLAMIQGDRLRLQ